MSFKDIIFPSHVSMGALGGPAFDGSTSVSSNAGIVWRNQASEMPRWEYEVSHAARMPAQWKPLKAFWLAVNGPSYSYRYWDHVDYQVESGEAGFLPVVTGSPGNQWQMCKLYTFGSETFYRRITKPISGTVSGIANFVSANYSTGIITTSGTPSGGTWQFHVHAAFATAAMKMLTLDKNNSEGYIIGWDSIPIVEVKREV